jgi:hypothetical protein
MPFCNVVPTLRFALPFPQALNASGVPSPERRHSVANRLRVSLVDRSEGCLRHNHRLAGTTS